MEFVQKHRELLDPESMCELQITRSMPKNSEYLETEFQLIQSDRSLNECIAELPAEQIRMVCPVEQTIRQIDQDDEWKLLEKAIGSQWTDKIRSSSQRKITWGGAMVRCWHSSCTAGVGPATVRPLLLYCLG